MDETGSWHRQFVVYESGARRVQHSRKWREFENGRTDVYDDYDDVEGVVGAWGSVVVKALRY